MTDNKYKTGKIYTIRNKNHDNLIYVGSTIQPLYKRFHAHKQTARASEREREREREREGERESVCKQDGLDRAFF